jgi:hypothetical protein
VVNDTTNNTGGFSKGSGGHFNNPCTGDCGDWLRNSNMYGAFVNGGVEDSWASWTATGAPSEGGVYEVFVFIPNVAVDTTTWQASYAVIHTEGTSSGVLDQMGSHGRWISIGAYRMSSGSAIVYVTDVGEAQGVHCGVGQYCRVGADAVKFVRRGTTYAPDARHNNGGWSSTATLRINGGTAKVVMRFLDSAGSAQCTVTATLAAHTVYAASCSDPDIASLAVDASQDVSVVVTHNKTDQSNIDNGFVPAPAGDFTFERTGALLYAPAFYNNYFNVSSELNLVNANANPVDVTVEFKDRNTSGSNDPVINYNVPANGKLVVSSSAIFGTGAWAGSLRIASLQPVAARVLELGANSASRSYNPMANGQATLYVPAAYKNNGGFLTGIVIQNLGSAATGVVVIYCDCPYTSCQTATVTRTVRGTDGVRPSCSPDKGVRALPHAAAPPLRLPFSLHEAHLYSTIH